MNTLLRFVFLNYEPSRVPATSMLPDSETGAIPKDCCDGAYSGGGYVDVQRRTEQKTGFDSYVVTMHD